MKTWFKIKKVNGKCCVVKNVKVGEKFLTQRIFESEDCSKAFQWAVDHVKVDLRLWRNEESGRKD